MSQHAAKTLKNTRPAVAEPLVQRQSAAGSALQAVMNDSAQVRQLKSSQEMLGNSPQVARLQQIAAQQKQNRTGLPDHLKSGIEQLSGLSMDDVKVHYNSAQPAQLNAHAYAQGNAIHLAPGQEKHLPHEAWHVVQQAQGRVRPTFQMKGNVRINDDLALEAEADVMGARARENGLKNQQAPNAPGSSPMSGRSQIAGVYSTSSQQLRKDSAIQLAIKYKTRTISTQDLSDDEIEFILEHKNAGSEKLLPFQLDTAEDYRLVEQEAAKRQAQQLVDEQLYRDVRGDKDIEDDEQDEDYMPTRQDELIANVTTYGRERAGINKIKIKKQNADESAMEVEMDEENELKPFGQKSIQGTIGEFLAQQALTALGDTVIDMNELALNFSGIDHMTTNPLRPFEQTKLHLADSTATVGTYLRHLEMADTYAVKAVIGLSKLKNLKQKLVDLGVSTNKFYQELLVALKDTKGQGNDIEGMKAHRMVSDGMHFSVPSDIYKKMPLPQRSRFIDLGWTVAELQKVMFDLRDDFIPAKPSGKKEDKMEEEWTDKANK